MVSPCTHKCRVGALNDQKDHRHLPVTSSFLFPTPYLIHITSFTSSNSSFCVFILHLTTMAAAAATSTRRRVHSSAAASGGHQPARKKSDRSLHSNTAYNRQKKKRFSLRDQFIRTNVDIYLLGAFFAIINGWRLHLQVVEAATVDELQYSNMNISDDTVKDQVGSYTRLKEISAIFFPM